MKNKITKGELEKRNEPSHHDLDEIFGGFQSFKSAEELVEEIYNLRTVGVQREVLNDETSHFLK